MSTIGRCILGSSYRWQEVLLLLSPGLISPLPLPSCLLNLRVQLVQFRRLQAQEEGETCGMIGSPLYLQMISSMCFLFS